ncbi:MAG: primosomal protein N' [Calditrichaeota bacterium]|nr:primosomal protein N' [Calditrichota bacterium]
MEKKSDKIFVNVAFNLPIDRLFSYNVPDELKNVQPGMRVLAPFGNQDITGVVVSVTEQCSWEDPKNIIDILDELPLVTEKMLNLTQWIAEYYLCSWGQAVFLALPRGTEEAVKEKVYLVQDASADNLSERQRELYLLIGEMPGNTKSFYRRKFGYGSFYNILNSLKKKGIIRIEKEYVEARVKELYRKFVHIDKDYSKRKEEHKDYLSYLKRRPEIDAYMRENAGRDILQARFLEETKMAHATLVKMCSYGLCEIIGKRVERKIEVDSEEEKEIVSLTDEQQHAVNAILPFIENEQFKPFLLHGVTGSGKTQVYIEVLKEVLKRGKSAIILIPEIALTPQTVRRFQKIVGEDIAVFHSKMSLGERFDYWTACYEGRIKCVVGPRSALLAPLDNIGLIVVDEEHEHTYKQTDMEPRYNARDVAIYWAKMNNAVVILGSATPSLESYFNARTGKYQLIEMMKRIDDVKMPAVEIIDMRRAKKFGGGELKLFSETMIEKIRDRLQKKEQVILLQNRRGFSAFMQCTECGYIPVCPNCDISLTYHSYGEKLQCHLCGHVMPAYQFCPDCGAKQIVYKGTGTQRIEKALLEILPDVKILRMDRDTTKGKHSHERILRAFGQGAADILLGTQMIAKGLDFSNVTMVGVVSADVGLSIPDFRAPERIFQLLTQVAGRAGRRQKEGEVVVQTYSHSHYAIQFAKLHDFSGFYFEEIRHRQNFRYPPYVRLIQILILNKDFSRTLNRAREITKILKSSVSRYSQVLGPAPAIIQRMNNLHRWVVTLKLNPQTDPTGKKTKQILKQRLKSYLGSRKKTDLVTVDVDPLSLN